MGEVCLCGEVGDFYNGDCITGKLTFVLKLTGRVTASAPLTGVHSWPFKLQILPWSLRINTHTHTHVRVHTRTAELLTYWKLSRETKAEMTIMSHLFNLARLSLYTVYTVCRISYMNTLHFQNTKCLNWYILIHLLQGGIPQQEKWLSVVAQISNQPPYLTCHQQTDVWTEPPGPDVLCCYVQEQ